MAGIADIIVRSPTDQVALVVECKANRDSTRQWAGELRRNLLEYGWLPESAFFLLALPTRFYLWQESRPSEAAPDYEIDPAPILQQYLRETNLTLDDLSGQSLELLVSAWLENLAHSPIAEEDVRPQLPWLIDSGLYKAIKNGVVVSEAAA